MNIMRLFINGNYQFRAPELQHLLHKIVAYSSIAIFALTLASIRSALAEPSPFEAPNLTRAKIMACDMGISRNETEAMIRRGRKPKLEWSEFESARAAADALPEEAINCVNRVMYDRLGPLPWSFSVQEVGTTETKIMTLQGMQRGSATDPQLGQISVTVVYGEVSGGEEVSFRVGPRVPTYRSRSQDPYKVSPVWRPRY